MTDPRKPDTFVLYDIHYDDEAMMNGDDLPEWMELEFSDAGMAFAEIEQHMSDYISNQTGWRHTGFSIAVRIPLHDDVEAA
jgi:hypothetical protein